MIKLKELLNEDTSNILDSTTTAEYIIQQQFEGYSWNDKIRNVDFEKAKNAYNGWMDVLQKETDQFLPVDNEANWRNFRTKSFYDTNLDRSSFRFDSDNNREIIILPLLQ